MPAKANHEKRLARGRRIRSLMSSELKSLSCGDIHIRDVLEDPPDALGSAPIYDVLCRTPKLGTKGAQKVCVEAAVWPLKKLAALTDEERTKVNVALPARVGTS